MAIVVETSTHAKYMMGKKEIDLSSDEYIAIMMQPEFTFDRNVHSVLADVASYQLATGNGYTQNAKILEGGSYTKDTTSSKGVRTFESPVWIAAEGDIGPYGSILIINNTTADKTIMNSISFGISDTVPAGQSFSPQNIKISVG